MKTEHIKRWRKGILQKHCGFLNYQFLNLVLFLLWLRMCINSKMCSRCFIQQRTKSDILR